MRAKAVMDIPRQETDFQDFCHKRAENYDVSNLADEYEMSTDKVRALIKSYGRANLDVVARRLVGWRSLRDQPFCDSSSETAA